MRFLKYGWGSSDRLHGLNTKDNISIVCLAADGGEQYQNLHSSDLNVSKLRVAFRVTEVLTELGKCQPALVLMTAICLHWS